MSKWLIVGLGNIGEEYTHTRHNIGFDVLDAFVQKHEEKFAVDRFADMATVKWAGKILICIKPTTYMNLSGKAVAYWMQREKIISSHVLVIVDDLALPLESLRLRPSGSDAGHNGLKSINEYTQNQNYPRLRFGIGNHFPKGRQVEFVLGKWTIQEESIVQKKVTISVQIIESMTMMGIDKTMNLFNNMTFDSA